MDTPTNGDKGEVEEDGLQTRCVSSPWCVFIIKNYFFLYCSSRFFWISDIHTMLRKLAEYQHDIHIRRPGAQKALEDFKAQQAELEGERERWCEQFSMGCYDDKQLAIDQRFKA
jgi:hypothetical protein